MGFVVAVALMVVAFVVFRTDRKYFIENAHDGAAIPMFSFIFLAVASNARRLGLTGEARFFAYGYVAIAALMALSAVVLFVAGGSHRVIRIEFAQIALFAVFWAVQPGSCGASACVRPRRVRVAVRRRRKPVLEDAGQRDRAGGSMAGVFISRGTPDDRHHHTPPPRRHRSRLLLPHRT